MELSEAVLEGLKVAGSSSVSDELFSSLLSRAFSVSQTSIDEGTVDIVWVCYKYELPGTYDSYLHQNQPRRKRRFRLCRCCYTKLPGWTQTQLVWRKFTSQFTFNRMILYPFDVQLSPGGVSVCSKPKQATYWHVIGECVYVWLMEIDCWLFSPPLNVFSMLTFMYHIAEEKVWTTRYSR